MTTSRWWTNLRSAHWGTTGVGGALRRATDLLTGRHDDDLTLLHRVLHGRGPATTPAHSSLVDMVIGHIDALPNDEIDYDVLLPWARYAVTSSQLLHDRAHPTTHNAIGVLVSVLRLACVRVHWPAELTGELIDAWGMLIDADTIVHGPHAAETLKTHTHQAAARHHLGDCQRALTDLARTWARWQHHHGTADAMILYIAGDALHACDAGASTWFRQQLHRLPVTAVEAAARLYQDPAFTSPISLPGHHRVCTYPRRARRVRAAVHRTVVRRS